MTQQVLDMVQIHEAQVWFENLKKQLHTTDESAINITQQGLEDIAVLLHKKSVGRWDDLMNDAQIEALKKQNNKINDVAKLIGGYFIRVVESEKNKVKPTQLDLDKMLYQTVSQILKTLRVNMDEAETPEKEPDDPEGEDYVKGSLIK